MTPDDTLRVHRESDDGGSACAYAVQVAIQDGLRDAVEVNQNVRSRPAGGGCGYWDEQL
jgi:hypothetical protein